MIEKECEIERNDIDGYRNKREGQVYGWKKDRLK